MDRGCAGNLGRDSVPRVRSVFRPSAPRVDAASNLIAVNAEFHASTLARWPAPHIWRRRAGHFDPTNGWFGNEGHSGYRRCQRLLLVSRQPVHRRIDPKSTEEIFANGRTISGN